MTLRLVVSREARADIAEAVAWFTDIAPVLPVRFPYSVFYVVEPAAVLIVGVVHQSRDESTWKRRS